MLIADRRGSPPQVRGKLWARPASAGAHRITPAGAGKTVRNGLPLRMGTDHPRRCGENAAATDSSTGAMGSPPQVRGKLSYLRSPCLVFRITPAGAGKTKHSAVCRPNGRDHPRRCGENDAVCGRNFFVKGSPPQVRGKLSKKETCPVDDRITPAGAGKTLLLCPALFPFRDHPRRCGENTKKIL